MELVQILKQQGIVDKQVLNAIASVPREKYVLEQYLKQAYENIALPINAGQTISQPYIVAYMTEKLMPISGQKILEIGTGSGYQAAILAQLGAEVFSVELIAELANKASETLHSNGYNVTIKIADGHDGWPEHAPYDAIIVTAASHQGIPNNLVKQLVTGGKMILPICADDTKQTHLYLITKKANGTISQEQLIAVRFVPLVITSNS